MKVNIKQFVQDRWTAEQNQTNKYIEGYIVTDEPFFFDGPVTRQVAVVDFNPDTGTVEPGAKFEPQDKGHKLGRYAIKDEHDLNARDLNLVCVFGTVFHTIQMFQEKESLGRPVGWAFNAPQLLVIPRAGEMANAYYERDSHSLQFFYFEHPKKAGQIVYTSQSRDIITHETSHAILDGIAPALYNAITPQSLALHEGFADLMALLSSFESQELRVRALAKTGGTLDCSNDFSELANEFGEALDRTNLKHYLRDLYNQKTLDPNDISNRVARNEPHELCQVLTGALYAVMVQLHKERSAQIAYREQISEFSASGKALAISAGKFKRRLVRALDYLPQGEVSFADYGRAILTVDKFTHPDEQTNTVRHVLIDEFVRRKIVPNPDTLKVKFSSDVAAVKALNLPELMESDWVAYQFANKNRELLHIPPGVDFKVAPRLDVRKTYWPEGEEKVVRECLLKVSWYTTEANNLGSLYPVNRKIQVGTTLAIDWETKEIHSLLTTDHAADLEGEDQRKDRTEFLRKMANDGILRAASQTDPYGKELSSTVNYETPDNIMRVIGAAKMLHIVDTERM